MTAAQNPRFPGLTKAGLVLAILGGGALVAGLGVAGREQFFHSYLLGFAVFLSLSMGSLILTMIHHLTGGAWGFMLRRTFEAAMANLLLMFALVIPIFLGLDSIYPWTHPEGAEAKVVAEKAAWLNPVGFKVRVAVLFAIWVALALYFRSRSLKLEQVAGTPAAVRLKDGLKNVSGPGIVIYAITITFACIDLFMSLEPTWYSTVYAMIVAVIQALFALAFGTALASMSAAAEPLRRGSASNRFHDLGNLMLAFTMLWGYTQLSQYLIIWSGNLPEEITWYLRRIEGSWGVYTRAYFGVHFVVPFLLLLFRTNKRDITKIGRLSCLVIFAVLLDFLWLIVPSFKREISGEFNLHWMDFAAIAAIGGIWLLMFARNMQSRALIPAGDPDLPAELALQSGGA